MVGRRKHRRAKITEKASGRTNWIKKERYDRTNKVAQCWLSLEEYDLLR